MQMHTNVTQVTIYCTEEYKKPQFLNRKNYKNLPFQLLGLRNLTESNSPNQHKDTIME